jgi:hypothetical protein
MNAEESLSLTPLQIRQIAQKTLENLLLFINLLCSLRDLFFDVCQLTLHATNVSTVNFTSLF